MPRVPKIAIFIIGLFERAIQRSPESLTEIANLTRASEKASGSAFSPAKVDNDDY
jgi:hypothetical protein